ncbi:MAG: hypothetical protein IPL38_16915 [Rhodobacter sp.]|nr:hypothetical protein [Rhodobacter sp.]
MGDRSSIFFALGLVMLVSAAVALHRWRTGHRTETLVILGAITLVAGLLFAIGNGMTRGFPAGMQYVLAAFALLAGPGLGWLVGLVLGLILGPCRKVPAA